MKKITFVLIALITGTTFAQNSKTATAPVNAEIVSPIGITRDTDTSMDFGKFTTSTAAATVVLSANGATRTFSATDMEIAAYGTFDVPAFTVTKDADALYKVAMSVTTQPGTEMTLTNLTHTLGADGANDESTFSIGGTLNVPADATAGAQSGLVSVTVTYE
ncbi:uncharacterized protein DUF4402 [Gillisia sp. Hel_I_86]|uniref:DUF4402 domain-containing protein n=1 Tax=Gillisia sp. Hel_I_86 TaxID=1249981 RepID=UPI0011995B3D|nr:DUF4402 domain-containing protein [Gillisia sp. Hel_I_86]TVZ28392.1 uncharacterized protein DUF4402 [Gillisia sp. Hel_I_86]